MIVAIVGSRELWVRNLGKYLPEGGDRDCFRRSKRRGYLCQRIRLGSRYPIEGISSGL